MLNRCCCFQLQNGEPNHLESPIKTFIPLELQKTPSALPLALFEVESMSPIRILPPFAIETSVATVVDLQFWMSSLEKTRKFKKRRDCDLSSLQHYVEKTKKKKCT
jgi:hypothetical protein